MSRKTPTPRYSAVLSYHMNPVTCGVAKFNHQLAKALGVPFLPLSGWGNHPLISVKPSELSGAGAELPYYCRSGRRELNSYSLFLHGGFPEGWDARLILTGATRVFAANSEIAEEVRPIRPDVVTAWCPSLVRGRSHRGAYQVLTFGMAHKLSTPFFQRLKALLKEAELDYTVSLSTAIHEGSPWDTIEEAGVMLEGVFGDRLRKLGFLGDDALAYELSRCDVVALAFDPAVRANNTTFWASVDRWCPIITVLDKHSPVPSVSNSIIDIRDVDGDWLRHPRMSPVAKGTSYGWDSLMGVITCGS